MGRLLKVAIVEDRQEDAELLILELQQAGFEIQASRVDDEAGYRRVLGQELDLIFSDYGLPAFSTSRALEILRETGKTIPFIVVSGTIGDERAVETLKKGADDYVLKDNLHRLSHVVERACQQIESRRERLRLEEQLNLQATALQNAANAIAITTPEGIFLWVNPAFERLTGYTAEEVIGLSPRILKSGKHDLEFYQDLWATIVAKSTWRGELTNRRKDGSIFYGEQTITPVCDPSGKITHFVGIMNDVTERKELEKRIFRAQRLESIGSLAGGIAHDLNNALTPILMAVEVLRDKITDSDGAGLLELLSMSAQRGGEMVKQLLTFSRGLDGGQAPLQLRHVLREVLTILRQTFPKSIQLNFNIASDLWPLIGDATQLHQLVMNLSVNARDAMPNGGTLRITAENALIDEHFATMSSGAKAGPHILVTVADSGSGISPKLRQKIFEPFFTTKGTKEGTGLGLSIVQSITSNHRGFIQIESQVERGTTFKIFLPAQPAARQIEIELDAELPVGKGELIVVVDDEEAVRILSKKTLEAFGYNVLTAGDGAQAVAVCARESGKVQLVVTDIAMPIMDGVAAIRAIRTLSPTIRIIVCTGLDARIPPDVTTDAALQKPFTAAHLLKAIRNVLDRPAPASAKAG